MNNIRIIKQALFEKISDFWEMLKLELSKKDPKLISVFNEKRSKKPLLIKDIKINCKKNKTELFDKSNMKLVGISGVSRDALELCNGNNTIEEIANKIYKKRILKNKFIEDLILLFDRLEKEGLVKWS